MQTVCIEEIGRFDQALLLDLTERQLIPVKILFANERKGSITIKAENKRTREFSVVKWCRENAPAETFEDFKRESKFYQMFHQNEIIPNLLQYSKRQLTIEYFDSITFRAWLWSYLTGLEQDKVSAQFSQHLTNLFTHLNKFYSAHLRQSTSNSNADLESLTNELIAIFYKLQLSGPMGTKISQPTYFLSRVLAKIARPHILSAVSFLVYDCYPRIPQTVFHGDLHLNNILTSENGDFRLIDFGTSSSCDFFIVDWLYLVTMLHALFSGFADHQLFIIKTTQEKAANFSDEFAPLFDNLFALMCLAISVNPRFHYNMSMAQLLEAQATYLPRLFKITRRIKGAHV